VVALHDRNSNGKLDAIFGGDGVALSRNPRLHFAKPKAEDVAITIGHEVKAVRLTFNYISGLSVGPVKR
jgi:uncharacterized protein (DUF2141 family)